MKKSTSIILATVLSFGTMSGMAQTSGGQHRKTKKHSSENTLRDTSGSSAADTSGSKKHPGGKRRHAITGTKADSTGKIRQ
ncbi:hypothetical protein GCM10023149_29150 [Mucilaginibacter gynuensis]|uniref:Pentapeptide MXKDX repeat protein n=1 Tax=Mucilaginibacter gynuensis TaxID=1302236 RepID=A0ABP8GLQ0_9SPHI